MLPATLYKVFAKKIKKITNILFMLCKVDKSLNIKLTEDCFHALAIINSAAMNTGVHVSLSDLVHVLFKKTMKFGLHSACFPELKQ